MSDDEPVTVATHDALRVAAGGTADAYSEVKHPRGIGGHFAPTAKRRPERGQRHPEYQAQKRKEDEEDEEKEKRRQKR